MPRTWRCPHQGKKGHRRIVETIKEIAKALDSWEEKTTHQKYLSFFFFGGFLRIPRSVPILCGVMCADKPMNGWHTCEIVGLKLQQVLHWTCTLETANSISHVRSSWTIRAHNPCIQLLGYRLTLAYTLDIVGYCDKQLDVADRISQEAKVKLRRRLL